MTNKSIPHIKLLCAVLPFVACISAGFALTAYSHGQVTSPSTGPGNKSTVTRTTVTQNSAHDLSLRLEALKSEATPSASVAECDQLRNHCGTSPESDDADPTPPLQEGGVLR